MPETNLPLIDPKVSKEVKAKRLRIARGLLCLSRNMIEKRYGLSQRSLQGWEDARRGGLTNKSAKRIIEIYRQEGLDISFEWLVNGIGEPPRLIERKITDFSGLITRQCNEEEIHSQQQELEQIAKELMIFREAYPDYMDMVVPDDAMLPRFIQGEFVAGCRFFGENIENILHEDCIVHLENNEILLRNIRPGNNSNLYTLACTNINTSHIEQPFLYNVPLISAAPVIWARRRRLIKLLK